MATRATLETETGRLLDDQAFDRWPTAIIDGYLDDGNIEFNRIARVFKSTFTITTSANTEEYSLLDSNSNAPLGPIERLINGTPSAPGAPLIRTTDGKLDILRSTAGTDWTAVAAGTPTRYIQSPIRNFNVVRLFPTPSGVATLTAWAAAQPLALSASSSVPEIPEEHHWALPFYAAYRCLLWNMDAGDPALAGVYKAQFEELASQAAAFTLNLGVPRVEAG